MTGTCRQLFDGHRLEAAEWLRRHVARAVLTSGLMLTVWVVVATPGSGATAAGTEVPNWPVALYGSWGVAVSELPTVLTVTQGAATQIRPSGSAKWAEPGSKVLFPVEVVNAGNGDDAFGLAASTTLGWGAVVYWDENADGVWQASETTAVSSTGELPPERSFACFLVVAIPAEADETDTATLTATSASDPGHTATGAYTVVPARSAFLQADFSGMGLQGIPPLTVEFADLSTSPEPITSRSWSFGDGSTATEQNPTHVYLTAGGCSVSPAATTGSGSPTLSGRSYISTASFADVPPDYWAYEEIMACYGAGIVFGYPDGLYRPQRKVSRDQMAAFIARALAGADDSVPPGPPEPSFPDVPRDHWSYRYVEYVAENNVVEGFSDGSYQPTWDVTRAQMAVFIARSLVAPAGDAGLSTYEPGGPTFKDVPSDYWAYVAIEHLSRAQIVVGYADGTYGPTQAVTRDQMAVFIARAFSTSPTVRNVASASYAGGLTVSIPFVVRVSR